MKKSGIGLPLRGKSVAETMSTGPDGHTYHFALTILAMALASCKPFKGEIINNVGHDVYLQIYNRSGKLDTYGQLKSGQTLTLNSEAIL